MQDLLRRPAVELAALVRRGEVSAEELVRESLARIDAVDDRLNAFVYVDDERALRVAADVRPGDPRPFAGVPIAFKDFGAPWGGRPRTYGSRLLGAYVAPTDGAPIARLRGAGFVPVGTTNTPEFGLLNVTEPIRHGPTRNPWDLSRTPGGSSGGSAAATAAGMVPLAHGTDGGGSLRIPAACCGLVGLKPSRGRVSHAPGQGESLIATDGVMTRTVGDAAATLDVIAGYELGDTTWAPSDGEPFATATRTEPEPQRIALVLDPPTQCSVAPEMSAAVHRAGTLLEELGHEIEPVELRWSLDDVRDDYYALWIVLTAAGVAATSALVGRDASPDLIEPLTLQMCERAKRIGSVQYALSLVELQRYARRVIAAMAPYDAVLTPVLSRPQVRIGEIRAEDGMDAFVEAGKFTPYTPVVNIMGLPAISLPLYEADGLPVPVQLIGRPSGERGLLSLAAQLERARPWADRKAPL